MKAVLRQGRFMVAQCIHRRAVTKRRARLRVLPQYALPARFLTRVHELINVFTMWAIPISRSGLPLKLPEGILHANAMPPFTQHDSRTSLKSYLLDTRSSSLEYRGFVLASRSEMAIDDHDRGIRAVSKHSDVYSRFQVAFQ